MKCVHMEEGKKNTPGDPRWRMWKPRRFTHTSREGFQIRILLANGFGRHRITSPPVYQLPVLSQAGPRPGSQPQHHTTFMAVRMLEPGYDRALDNCARRFHPRIGGHRQVYEVDRVQDDYEVLCRSSGQLHLRHLALIRLPQYHHHGFWIQLPLT
jgi:hypothetical protein